MLVSVWPSVCNLLPSPLSGNVTITPNLTSALYTCDIGYTIDGLTERSCSDNGAGWSGVQPACGKFASNLNT